MKKKFLKSFVAFAAVAVAGLGSYKAYGSYTDADMTEDDVLLSENVLALSLSENLSGQKVRVRAEDLGYCWKNSNQIVRVSS